MEQTEEVKEMLEVLSGEGYHFIHNSQLLRNASFSMSIDENEKEAGHSFEAHMRIDYRPLVAEKGIGSLLDLCDKDRVIAFVNSKDGRKRFKCLAEGKFTKRDGEVVKAIGLNAARDELRKFCESTVESPIEYEPKTGRTKMTAVQRGAKLLGQISKREQAKAFAQAALENGEITADQVAEYENRLFAVLTAGMGS